MPSPAEIVSSVRSGSVRALAKTLTKIENGSPDSTAVLDGLFKHHKGFTIGVTGPPGAGKSTLVDRIITRYRKAGDLVGVIAVDPSSPFTGGALLGDRIRMQKHATDPGVFIRSMGSRGHLGGLSGATRDATLVISSAGYNPVIIETVGVGQAEVEIADLADITLLVLVPGLGDDVQSMKAGIMEIGDVIVLNKADRSGIDQLESYVKASLELIPQGRKRPEVIRVSAVTGEGLENLWTAVDKLLDSQSEEQRFSRWATRTLNGVLKECGGILSNKLLKMEYNGREQLENLIIRGEVSPYAVGEKLLERAERMLNHNGSK